MSERPSSKLVLLAGPAPWPRGGTATEGLSLGQDRAKVASEHDELALAGGVLRRACRESRPAPGRDDAVDAHGVLVFAGFEIASGIPGHGDLECQVREWPVMRELARDDQLVELRVDAAPGDVLDLEQRGVRAGALLDGIVDDSAGVASMKPCGSQSSYIGPAVLLKSLTKN